MTKKLSLFGNPEDLKQEFEKLVNKYKAQNIAFDVDPDVIGTDQVKSNEFSYDIGASPNKNKTYNFGETKASSP